MAFSGPSTLPSSNHGCKYSELMKPFKCLVQSLGTLQRTKEHVKHKDIKNEAWGSIRPHPRSLSEICGLSPILKVFIDDEMYS